MEPKQRLFQHLLIAISRILTFKMSGKISLMHAYMKILVLLQRSAKCSSGGAA